MARWNKWFPADFITESFPGQFRNWFYSLLVMAAGLENKPATRTVLGYGTLLAEDGRAMHKSWGNAIEFNEAADTIGADVMRWQYCQQPPSQDLWFGYGPAQEIQRKLGTVKDRLGVEILDNVDAKMHMSLAATRGPRARLDLGGNFTERMWALDTKLFKPDPLG